MPSRARSGARQSRRLCDRGGGGVAFAAVPLDSKTVWLAKQQTEFAATLLDLADAHSRDPDALKLAGKSLIQRMISAQNSMAFLGSQLPAQFDVRLDLMTL